jgi:hypothetical protein
LGAICDGGRLINKKMKKIKILSLVIISILLLSTQSSVNSKDVKTIIKELITQKEAQLPPAKGDLKTRGISRGPGITVLSPDVSRADVKSPFDFKVKFEPRGGVKVDASSVKVTYLKFPYVDLTERVRPAISENGINLEKAAIPAGEHSVRITVKDADGRESNATVTLVVTK